MLFGRCGMLRIMAQTKMFDYLVGKTKSLRTKTLRKVILP